MQEDKEEEMEEVDEEREEDEEEEEPCNLSPPLHHVPVWCQS